MSCYWKSIGMGWVAGMRAMTAPALVSAHLSSRPGASTEGPIGLLARNEVATGLHFLAAGEMAADKTPWIPDRISPPALAARAISGALVGAALTSEEDGDRKVGAVLGSLAAVAASFGMYHLRKNLGNSLHVPDTILGTLEDAAALGAGHYILGDCCTSVVDCAREPAAPATEAEPALAAA